MATILLPFMVIIALQILLLSINNNIIILRLLLMSNIKVFREMIQDLKSDVLSEICEQFLFDHEGAMKVLKEHCIKFGMNISDLEIKNNMTDMHSNGEFDHVECFGIELSENQLYKKFHPS